MSAKSSHYLAEAERVAALADGAHDPGTRSTLREAAKTWRMLAELEAAPSIASRSVGDARDDEPAAQGAAAPTTRS